MINSSMGSPGAKSDEKRAQGRAPEGGPEDQEAQTPLADASQGAAADRRRTGTVPDDSGGSAADELDQESPGFTAEAEADAS